MSSTPKVFKNRCDYRSIDGTICNKKCIDTKCSSHKKCESYTIQCIYRDASGIQCSRYTRSKVCKCSQHARCPIPKLDETAKQDEPVEEDQTEKIEKIDDTVKHVKPNAVEGENTKTAKTSKPSAAPGTTAGSYAIVEPMNRKMQLARAAKQMKAEQRLSEITKKIKQVQVNDDESDEDDDE